MGRVKTLVGNTAIFAVCNFTSKLLVFFMLPFYTSVMSKEEFGTADLISTIVGLLYPVFTLGIANGCMRYALDSKVDKNKVFSIGVCITIIGAILLVLLCPLITCLDVINTHLLVFVCLYFVNIFQQLFSLFARGIQKVRLVGVAGVASSFIIVFCNILLLFVFHFGVEGYLWSMVISNIVSILILFIGGKMYQYLTIRKDYQLASEMIRYSVPLMPNSISWWVNHSANRLILNYYCGVSDVGMYSAASKMPSMIDTFRGIFIQAWQLSTITEYEKKDSNSFFEGMYRVYHYFLIMLTGGLILLSQVLGNILYSESFSMAWKTTPLLFVGILFGSLIAYYSPTYLAHKKTKVLFFSTFLGAIATIVFNFILVPNYGIVGAAVTSILSNLIIYIYLHVDSRKYMDFKVDNKGYYISYILLSIMGFAISCYEFSPTGFASILCYLALFFINIKDFKLITSMMTKIIQNKNRN